MNESIEPLAAQPDPKGKPVARDLLAALSESIDQARRDREKRTRE